jgi:hypothetical protein
VIERGKERLDAPLERRRHFRVERLLAQAWRVLLARDLARAAAPCHTVHSGDFALSFFQMAKKSLVKINRYRKGVGR